MNRKKEIQKELESISPFLAKIDRSKTPEMPYLYFDKLADTVLNQVKEEEKATWWSLLLNQFTARNVMAFASLAIIIVATVMLLLPSTNVESDPFASLETSEINDYIAMHIEDFDESALYEYTDVSTDFLEENNDIEIDDLMGEWVEDIDIEIIEEFL